MRVTKRFRSEESGAVMMIVALSLVFLIGMLALTVDLGRMIAVKREMVRAADAAALAAAQECALRHGSVEAKKAAETIATENHAGSNLVSFTIDPQCDNPTTTDAKLVTVKFQTTLNMFFAGIFGINSGTVGAEATASWKAAGPIPITVNVAPLENCKLRPEENCVIEYPKETLLEPRWGILDLEHWNQTLDSCPLSASYVTGIITGGGWPEPLPLNGKSGETSPPTYDCLDNGLQFSSWDALEGRTFWFPVIDVPTSLTENGLKEGLDPACPKCRVVNANVIEFVQMEVLTVVNEGSTVVLTTKLIRSDPSSVPGIAIRLVD
jgi:Flp pilus assembly protein TadG